MPEPRLIGGSSDPRGRRLPGVIMPHPSVHDPYNRHTMDKKKPKPKPPPKPDDDDIVGTFFGNT